MKGSFAVEKHFERKKRPHVWMAGFDKLEHGFIIFAIVTPTRSLFRVLQDIVMLANTLILLFVKIQDWVISVSKPAVLFYPRLEMSFDIELGEREKLIGSFINGDKMYTVHHKLAQVEVLYRESESWR